MAYLKEWAEERSDRAPEAWREAIARLREALGHAPGSAGRDNLLARFFSLAEEAKTSAGWANDLASGRHHVHLYRAIDRGVDALIDGVADSPDDDDRIRDLIEQYAGQVGGAIERLLRASREEERA